MRKILTSIMLMVLVLSLIGCEDSTEIIEENYLKTLEVHVEDVINGAGDTKIGEYAYVNADKKTFEELEDIYLIEFSKDVVEDSGYNWMLIKFDDGTGIAYTGSMIEILTYGKVNSYDMVSEVMGYYLIKNDEITYKEK